MEKDGLLILVQVDHLSGEDLAWVIKALDMPGVRNRNLLPTVTKKGRAGHLLLLDIDPGAEAEVARFIVETIGSYGYHRIQSSHVYHATTIRERKLVIRRGGKEISEVVRLKSRRGDESGSFTFECEDLFSLLKRIREELDCFLSPMELRRKIEGAGEPAEGVWYICL